MPTLTQTKSLAHQVMARSPDRATDQDSALGAVFEEITSRLLANPTANLESLIAEYPDHAERLLHLLPAMRAMATVGFSAVGNGLCAVPTSGVAGVERSEPPAGVPRALPVDSDHGRLGDFRLIREVGRGGMGVVYEAEQISLGRRVALKVLPFAAVLDDRQLARFKNEARAAATLHHTNIVPVFSVGCEKGVHFYAMQFIEGHSLAQLIDELRQSRLSLRESTKNVARIPAPLDETIERCSQSTLHEPPRSNSPASSLPPQNSPAFYRAIARLGIQAAEALEHAHQHGVLHRDIKPANLMLDAAGNLWITDFGLARLETDAGMTMTGDLVGTLRYMSPEQALGKRVTIDHRTDIYSLGVTLYELLTQHPPFDGQDRAAVLRQIAFDEPKPLRRHTRHIPRELETIVLKAIEKSPEDRYVTSQSLVEDLRRFLDDKPIVARRPSWVDQARKWTRRHSGAVAVALVSLAVLTVGLAIGMVALFAEQRKTQSALDDKAIALATAETNFDLAADAAEQMLDRVAHLTSYYRDQQHTRLMLGDVIDSYKRLLSKSDSALLKSRAVRVFLRVADMYRGASMPDDALRVAREALPLAEQVCDRFPGDLEHLYSFGRSHNAIGAALWAQRKFEDAIPSLEEALRITEDLAAKAPDERRYQIALATILTNIGFWHGWQGRSAEAEPMCRRAMALAKAAAGDSEKLNTRECMELGNIVGNLAMVRRDQDDYAESEALTQEAARYFLRASELEPRNPAYRDKLYTLDFNLADLRLTQRKHAEAAVAAQELIERHPQRLQAYYESVVLLLGCAELARDDDRSGDAASRYVAWAREAAAKCRRATQRPPEWLNRMAWLLANCADESMRNPDLALLFAKEAVRTAPTNVSFLNTLGATHYRRGQLAPALDVLRQSVARAAEGTERGLLLLSMVYWQLGQQENALKTHRKAMELVGKKERPSARDTTYEFLFDEEDTERLQKEVAALITSAHKSPKSPKPPEP